MESTTKLVWTLCAVTRPTRDGWAFVVVPAAWDTATDMFTYTIPGELHRQWHRRGMPVFNARKEALAYVRRHGWPLG